MYSRVLGSPNHQFSDPMILPGKDFRPTNFKIFPAGEREAGWWNRSLLCWQFSMMHDLQNGWRGETTRIREYHSNIKNLYKAYPYHSCMGIHEWYNFHGFHVGKSLTQCHGWIWDMLDTPPPINSGKPGAGWGDGVISNISRSPSMGRRTVYFYLHENHENQPISCR